jgi:hypothetical protein
VRGYSNKNKEELIVMVKQSRHRHVRVFVVLTVVIGLDQQPLSEEREKVEAAKRDKQRPATARHLLLFFRIVHSAVWAFLSPELEPLMRLELSWYAYYVTKGWEAYARKRKNMSDDFLTVNQRDCVYLNAHSLLLYTWWLADNEQVRQHVPFAPHLLGSQQCESMF